MKQSDIEQKLFQLRDLPYKVFQEKLMPTVDPDTVIGVRIPALRKLARELHAQAKTKEFLSDLPHRYYEENNLHAFLIEQISDFNACICELERFLPHVNNWATCDSMRPKCFSNHKKELLERVLIWLQSDKPYTVRFGIETLMLYYLESDFEERFLALVASTESEEYYVNMMIAWYFATALAKQYDLVLPYLENNRLSLWVHNKTIQKAIESYRISDAQKAYLRTLKRRA